MSSTSTFPLFGYERFFAMDPRTSAKLAHVMTIRGDVSTLMQHLPTAVRATFNLHPKMRAALLPGHSPLKAMICPHLLDATELTAALYSVSEVEDEAESPGWMQRIQTACEEPFNREQDLPFAFRVFLDTSDSAFARIVVFSDHYMSDAASGAIVLNAVLQNASALAIAETATAPLPIQELPLQPSLYESMHWVNPWVGVLNEAVSKWVIEPLFKLDHAGFTPLLPVDTVTQRDFTGAPPSVANPSAALFAQGSAENMQRALAQCLTEGVSFQGALIAATILAFGLATHDGKLRTSASDAPLMLKMDVTCDMRKNALKKTKETTSDSVQPSNSDDIVGLYSTAANLVFTSSEGVNAHTMGFWALARKVDYEVQCLLVGHELKLQSVYVHETLNAERPDGDSSLQVQHCVLSDVGVTSLGAYPFAPRVALGDDATVAVDTLHVYNSLPSLAPATMLFASAVTCFNYSMMHKLERDAATDLFHWYVQSVEHMGNYSSTDTLVTASEHFTAAAATVGQSSVAATQM